MKLVVFLIPIVISIIFDWGFIRNSSRIPNYKIIYYPSCSLIRGCSGAFYIYIGSLIKKLFSKLSLKILMIITILVIPLSIKLSLLNGATDYSKLNLGNYPFCLYICGILGSFILLSITLFMYKFYDRIKILEWCGVNSLELLATHQNWRITVIIIFLLNRIWLPTTEIGINFRSLIGLILMVFIEIPIIQILRPLLYKIRCQIKE